METKRPTVASLRIDKPTVALLAVALAAVTASAQDYRSSVVGTDFDFILDTDPSTFLCLEFKGQGLREMPDKTGPSPLIQQAFIFVSYFGDGTSVDMAIDSDFGTEAAARREALRYVPRIGKLPTSLRSGVDRMVVHKGGENATAFSDVGLIVLYSDNATKRISTHDLEETIFHESVHASWDLAHARSTEWRAAQTSDGGFVTHYAKNNPEGEDLAESALFAYTLLHHPERIPATDAARITTAIPARISFVETLLPPNESIVQNVGPRYACDGSGTTFTVSAERYQAPRDAFEAGGAARVEGSAPSACSVDLSRVGILSDILSNALMRGLDQEESAVTSFLSGANVKYSNSEELLEAAAAEFGIARATLDAQVQEFLHCNCNHDDGVETGFDTSPRGSAIAEAGAASGSASQDDIGTTRLTGILYLIALLLLLLLIVNASTLVVLLKQFKAER